MIWARIQTEKKKYLYNVNRYLLLPIKKENVSTTIYRTFYIIFHSFYHCMFQVSVYK